MKTIWQACITALGAAALAVALILGASSAASALTPLASVAIEVVCIDGVCEPKVECDDNWFYVEDENICVPTASCGFTFFAARDITDDPIDDTSSDESESVEYWYNDSTNTCEPKAECEHEALYNEENNTCDGKNGCGFTFFAAREDGSSGADDDCAPELPTLEVCFPWGPVLSGPFPLASPMLPSASLPLSAGGIG